eukprot:scaffold988_cov393-Pavlova_lutheri.AAC.4
MAGVVSGGDAIGSPPPPGLCRSLFPERVSSPRGREETPRKGRGRSRRWTEREVGCTFEHRKGETAVGEMHRPCAPTRESCVWTQQHPARRSTMTSQSENLPTRPHASGPVQAGCMDIPSRPPCEWTCPSRMHGHPISTPMRMDLSKQDARASHLDPHANGPVQAGCMDIPSRPPCDRFSSMMNGPPRRPRRKQACG